MINVDINTNNNYLPEDKLKIDDLSFIVAIIDSRVNTSDRYARILSKSDLYYYLNIDRPGDNYWNNTLYFLAGNVECYIYKNIQDVRPEDKIDLYLFDLDHGLGYVSELENRAYLFSLMDVMTLANLNDISLANINLYNPIIRKEVAIFWGYSKAHGYNSFYLAADFIIMLKRYFQNERIFCGIIGKTTGICHGMNRNDFTILVNNNINTCIRHSIMNPKNLEGKLFHHVYVNKWIKRRIKTILLSYIGHENDYNLWKDAQNTLELFGKYLESKPCGPVNFRVLLDETNNTPNSNTLNAEIHYYGSTTDGFRDIQTIQVTINLR